MIARAARRRRLNWLAIHWYVRATGLTAGVALVLALRAVLDADWPTLLAAALLLAAAVADARIRRDQVRNAWNAGFVRSLDHTNRFDRGEIPARYNLAAPQPWETEATITPKQARN